MIRPLYLDYNGTTPHDPEVVEAMRPFLEAEFGNPSSSHWYGIVPKRAVDKARLQAAKLLNCGEKEIVFTSGGTESNNHAIRGAAGAHRGKGNHIVTTAIEHPAVLEVCRDLERSGWEIDYVPVDSSGMVDPSEVERAIRPETVMISVMYANNEVGTVQPIAEISKIAWKNRILLHTDASQAIGKIPTDVSRLRVDLLTVAGHKLYAPKGVGALYIREGVRIDKFCHGAGQERGFRAGTENVLEIVGLGKACEIAARDLNEQMLRLKTLRDRLWEGLCERLGEIRLNGHPVERLPNTLSVSFRGLEANRILEEIGLEVAASAGAACHSDRVEISHVLLAMKVPQEWAKGTLRFSVGRMTTTEEIEKAIEIVASAVRRLRGSPDF